MTSATSQHHDRVVSSQLWAAWADALGFISELTDEAGLRRRIGNRDLTEPLAWKRRVGGRFGVIADLPAGTYSDDTQLRLATGRAISAQGFDVEAFAAVELTNWPAYALGGGRASKAAAANMTKAGNPWFGNFFKGWTEAGGNGAAMRVQPHVWAARNSDEPSSFVRAVLANAITTHGHPRALLGAVLHAVVLGEALRDDHAPVPGSWSEMLEIAHDAIIGFEAEDAVAGVWLPAWERETGQRFRSVWEESTNECRDLLTAAKLLVTDLRATRSQVDRDNVYEKYLDALGLRNEVTRGSGTGTVIAALALAAGCPKHPAHSAMTAARAVGTDTDTIATMAAAIAAAANPVELPKPLQDMDYLTAEALRLADVAAGGEPDRFAYPDLLAWSPPRSQLDVVGLAGEPAIAGLGTLTPVSYAEVYQSRDAQWAWMRADFGQTLLLKRREVLRELPPGNAPARARSAALAIAERQHAQVEQMLIQQRSSCNTASVSDSTITIHDNGPGMTADELVREISRPAGSSIIDIDVILDWVRRNNFSDRAVGYAVNRVAADGTLEQLVALTVALRNVSRDRG
ncbi:ADP-ribosylglycohydrolase family protein [Saccharothrix sp. BKS2]|uniref:ADP-ribosylglycohydrolase family protein n=1 Tax=Saccharothrix sp. BKS2 TaxID=3064400 RepID=UPI0039EA2C55